MCQQDKIKISLNLKVIIKGDFKGDFLIPIGIIFFVCFYFLVVCPPPQILEIGTSQTLSKTSLLSYPHLPISTENLRLPRHP